MNNSHGWDVAVKTALPELSPAETLGVHDQAVHSIAWNLVRSAVALLSSAAIVVAARALGPSQTGVYSYAMWVINIVITLGVLTLPQTTVKYVSEFLGAGKQDLARQVARRLVSIQTALAISASMMGLVVWLAVYRHIEWALWALATVIATSMTADNAAVAVLEGLRRFDRIAQASLAGALVQITGIALVALLHGGVAGVLASVAIGSIVALLFRFRDSKRLLLGEFAVVSPHRHDPVGSRIRTFSAITSFILLVNMVLWQRFEFFFVRRYLGLEEIGFYAIAYGIAVKVIQVGDALTHPLMPVFSTYFGQRGIQSIGEYLSSALKYITMITAPLSLACLALSRPAVEVLFGDNFVVAVLPLQLLLLGAPISAAAVIVFALLYAIDKTSVIAIGSAGLAAIKIILAVLLIPRYAIIGAALSNVLPQLLAVCMALAYIVVVLKTEVRISGALRVYGLALAAFVPALVAAWFIPSWKTAACAIVGAAGYCALLVYTGDLRPSDWARLRRLVTRRTG